MLYCVVACSVCDESYVCERVILTYSNVNSLADGGQCFIGTSTVMIHSPRGHHLVIP